MVSFLDVGVFSGGGVCLFCFSKLYRSVSLC